MSKKLYVGNLSYDVSETQLRDAWDGWSVPERRVWLRRVFAMVIVKPATALGRGSKVEDRMDPVWRI